LVESKSSAETTKMFCFCLHPFMVMESTLEH
jgi:hypothetical protein